MKNALIMGATGETGRSLILLLLQSPLYKEIHIVHYKNTGIAAHPKIIEHILNMDRLQDQLSIDSEIHEVFCTIGTTRKKAGSAKEFIRVDLDYVIELAHWSKRKEVVQFNVISSTGANKNSSFLYLKTKGKMEEQLKKINFEQLNIFRPPLLFAPNRVEVRLAETWTLPILHFLSQIFPKLMINQTPLNVNALAQKMVLIAQEKKGSIRTLTPIDLH